MKFFKQGELKLLWPFYLDALISPMLFFMPAFIVVYFRDLGLSIFQISILTMTMLLFTILFEIPTGAIADVYGRKFSVLLSAIIEGSALFSIFFLTNYYALLFAFAIAGIGSTFSSGAKEAWVTDLIKKERKDFLHRYFAKSSSIDSVGLVVSGILGAFLVKHFGLSIIWIVAGMSFLITFLLLGFARENFVKRKVKIKDSFKSVIKQANISVRYARYHTVLFWFLIASIFLVFASEFNEFLVWVPFLQNLGFPDYAFGYMWSAMGFVGVFASLISLKFMKKGGERKFILGIIVSAIIFLFLIIFVQTIAFALLILISFTFLAKMAHPPERVFFHRFIKSKLRATVGSVESMLIGIVAAVALPLAGLSVDHLGPRFTIVIAALLMIPAAIIFLRMKD